MKKACILCLHVGLILLISSIASAIDCPQELAGDFPLCKEATVLQTTHVNGATIASLQMNKAMDTVYGAYKAAAQKNGWNILMETKQQDGMMLVGEKAERQLILHLSPEDNATLIQLSIGKKN